MAVGLVHGKALKRSALTALRFYEPTTEQAIHLTTRPESPWPSIIFLSIEDKRHDQSRPLVSGTSYFLGPFWPLQ